MLTITAPFTFEVSKSIEELSVDDLESIEGIISASLGREQLAKEIDISTMLTELNIFSSKGEAKKMIANGGVHVNRKKVESPQEVILQSMLLHKKYLLVQKGKKNYYLIKLV